MTTLTELQTYHLSVYAYLISESSRERNVQKTKIGPIYTVKHYTGPIALYNVVNNNLLL
jgi:hypothetical protein